MFIWKKCNPEFQLGVNIYSEKFLKEKIFKDWTDLVNISLGKKGQKEKEKIVSKLDSLYNILLCKCDIQTCEVKNCPITCKDKVHICCSCPREKKIPKIELEWIYDQKSKKGRKGKMQLARVDLPESQRLSKKQQRKSEEENLKRREQTEYIDTVVSVTTEDFEDVIECNKNPDNDDD